jgi:carbon monoxide dehydrogenase subunit G
MVARRTRLIDAPADAIWAVVADPHHFPRWWPGVVRVEGVHGDRFTQVYTTKRGRAVRMDFRLLGSDPPVDGGPAQVSFEQEVRGTPFERVLNQSITEVAIEAEDRATRVTIAQQQRLRGYSRTGGWMLRRATGKRLQEALEGLERATAAGR